MFLFRLGLYCHRRLFHRLSIALNRTIAKSLQDCISEKLMHPLLPFFSCLLAKIVFESGVDCRNQECLTSFLLALFR